MSTRFSALKPNPQNTFKSRPSLNCSNKGWDRSDLDRGRSNKKNNYAPPSMRQRDNNSFNTYRQRKPAFKPILSFKEKDGDFPTFGESMEVEQSNMVNFANIVKNKEKPVEEVIEEIDPVPQGWIRWKRVKNTQKWIEEIGVKSKERKQFIKWINRFNDYKRFIAFENYLDRLEEEQFNELELNGPQYINAWEVSLKEPTYDSDPEIDEDYSDSEEEEFLYENDFY